MSDRITLSNLFLAYKQWVSSNPQLSADVETTVKWVSYFVAGRIHNSNTLSELIYSLSNLLVLFNDRIIYYSRNARREHGQKLKTFLTVVEYAEVFLEISARKLWGQRGRWIVIFIIQMFKCLSRLALLLLYKEKIVRCPPIAPLQRKTVEETPRDATFEARVQQNSETFTLKTTGRVIRTVAAAPPLHCRSWKAPQPPPLTEEEEEALGQQQTLAETIYIMKPICHLASTLWLGQDKWQPWMLSLLMDVTSLQMYRRSQVLITKKQRLEMSRRTLCLLLYILRSPFYERFSGRRLQSLLQTFSERIPLARLICHPLQRYIPEWQAIYFYMWSS